MQEKKKSKDREDNQNLSKELLSSYRAALYKIKETFDSLTFNKNDIKESIKISQIIMLIGEKLGKNIETLSILEKKVAADEDVKAKVRGNATPGLFEDQSHGN